MTKINWECKGSTMYIRSGRFTLVQSFKGCKRIPFGHIMGAQQYIEFLLDQDKRIIEGQGYATGKDIEPRTIRLERCKYRH